MPRIVADREKCTGLGLCESIAPDVFEIDDDGTLIVLEESHGRGRRGELRAADSREGLAAVIERRDPKFTGH